MSRWGSEGGRLTPEDASRDEQPGEAGLNAIARRRRKSEDFSASFEALQDAVRSACAGHTKWEERVAAGIHASLDFAAARPGAASAVTIDARRNANAERDPEHEVIAYFAELLTAAAPGAERTGVSSDEAIVQSIATVIRGQLISGEPAQLPGLAPELIYLALMPYAGIESARRWAGTSSLQDISGT